MSTGVTHSSLISATIAYLPGVSDVRNFGQEIRVDSGHEQVGKTSRHRAGQCPDCETNRAAQQTDETADRRSAHRSNRKIAFALFHRDRPIIVLADDGFGMDRDASLGIELIERSRSLVRFGFIVENYH